MKKTVYYFVCLYLVSIGCSSNHKIVDPVPVHEHFQLQSAAVNENRTINVWLPDGYSVSTDSLPVMYMADGGIEEDFPHIANSFAALIRANKIPAFILVGIENTQRRRDLTGPTTIASDKEIAPVVGGAASFRKFLAMELIPEINKRYRTNAHKGILGESLSGLFVLETFFLQPGLFDYYIAFDPSLWWNNQYLVNQSKALLTNPAISGKKVWFAGSGAEDIYIHTRKLADIFRKTALPNLTWMYSDEPNEEHSTIFRATKEKALIWTLSGAK
jgi:predicted alpha/beta superfamily hydrolase